MFSSNKVFSSDRLKPVVRNEVEVFLLGCFLQIGGSHITVQISLITPQGTIKKGKIKNMADTERITYP